MFQKKRFVTCWLTFCFTLISLYGNAQFKHKIIWEDTFSKTEKEKLTTWITEVGNATVKTLGNYPFETVLYFHRKETGKGPVPWAHTDRGAEQAVHFYVNPTLSLQTFREDWTAAHEISHLSLPFLGKSNMWFSEGYASFMQWQIMCVQGVISDSQKKEKLSSRINKIKDVYNSELPFKELSKNLKKQYSYPAVYYGGASFFVQIDKELQENYNTTLTEVIKEYVKSARMKDEDITDVIRSFTNISNCKAITQLFKIFDKGSAKEAVYSPNI